MKTTKFAPVAFALLLNFVIHFWVSYDFFNSSINFKRYIFTSTLTTGFYFILGLITFGFFIVEPLRQSKGIKNANTFTNWWWQIYLSIWCLMGITLIEYFVMENFPEVFKNSIRKGLVEYPSILFLIKGFLLIPAHIKNTELVDSSKRVKLTPAFIFELVLIFLFFLIMNLMSDSVPEFGE